jgi:hypothetical protein
VIKRGPLAVAAALALTGAAVMAGQPAGAASADVVISQVYGGGGNSGATLKNDYVQLYNHGTAPIDLAGWSVQYAAKTGASWQVTPLSGQVAAGARFLVAEAAGAGGTTDLPTPDVTGSIAMSATNGKVALVENADALTCGATCAAATGVHDFVGYGAANDAEGGHPAPVLSNTTADIRAGSGATDTDDNAADFAAGTPDPEGSGGNQPPPVGISGLQIHDIQGAALQSSYAGKNVLDVPGVVTAVDSTQLWMQDPEPDNNSGTSEGIVVYTGGKPTAAVGDSITVSGTVKEFRPGSSTSTNLTTTELDSPTVTITGHNVALPRPTRIGPGGRIPPSRVIDSGDSGDIEQNHVFDPRRNGIDFWESLEGMRVELDNAQVVGPTNSFGETEVVPVGSSIRTSRGGIVARADDFNPERVVLAPTLANVPTANVGDSYRGATVGVLDYDFGNYEILPTVGPVLHKGNLQRQVVRKATRNDLSVATFNVENLAPSDPQSKFDTLGQYAAHNLAAPDVLALEEIQDNDGATDDGVVAANQTLQKLVDAIKAAGGPTYQWAEIDPTNDADGGEPGGNIRVAFLYRTDRGLQFVSRGQGDATTATTVVTDAHHQPELSLSPGRISPTDAAWNASRKPLAGQFTFHGRTVFVIANHFDAKLGDDPLFGRYQPPKEPSAVQRHQQATLVNEFVGDIEKVDQNADVVVVGDLNDFDFSGTTAILTGSHRLVDLPSTLPVQQRYTYVYEGNSEVLDHILLSPALAKPSTYDYQPVHLNSEFADQISDHDPQIVRLEMPGH